MAKRFDPEARELFLAHLRAGMRPGAAAEILDFPRHVVAGYISEHPEFGAQVLEAEQDAVEHVEEALYQAAISGSVAACKLWLDRVGAGRRSSPPSGDVPAGAMESGGELGRIIDDELGD
jgi:hypothetical protein